MVAASSLAFRALDLHVVRGRAEEVALRDAAGVLSVADLLHESASIAGAWRLLGLTAGDPLALDVTGRHRVVAVLAAVRLQVVPGPDLARLSGEPPVLALGSQEVPWATARQLGRTDPLPAPEHDDPAALAWLEHHGDVIETLLAGGAVDLTHGGAGRP